MTSGGGTKKSRRSLYVATRSFLPKTNGPCVMRLLCRRASLKSKGQTRYVSCRKNEKPLLGLTMSHIVDGERDNA